MLYIILAILLIVVIGCVINYKMMEKKSLGPLNPFDDRTKNVALSELYRAIDHLKKESTIFTYRTTDSKGRPYNYNETQIAEFIREARVRWRYVELATAQKFISRMDGAAFINNLSETETQKLREAMIVLIETDIELLGGGFETIAARLDSIIEMNHAGQASLSIPNSTLLQKATR